MTLSPVLAGAKHLRPPARARVPRVDVAIVGAGIVGLAHALQAARRGLRVAVFERDARALGASIRNFGLVLPTGMAAGRLRQLALESRAEWLALAQLGGFWHAAAGLLLAAHHADEMQVLSEFVAAEAGAGELLNAEQAAARSPALRRAALLGGLYSPREVLVDAPGALAWLPHYLHEQLQVQLYYGHAVRAVEAPELVTSRGRWRAERVVVCSGADLETLYPDLLQRSGLVKCKLQMLRTVPQPAGWQLGPALATGLSLPHYAAFAGCATLPELRQRLAKEYPQLVQRGIHLLAAHTATGGLLIGDSHEYGATVDPFDSVETDELILAQLQRVLAVPTLQLAQRWHGVYARHLESGPLTLVPHPQVRVVVGVAGAGMTLSFGLARETFDAWT